MERFEETDGEPRSGVQGAITWWPDEVIVDAWTGEALDDLETVTIPHGPTSAETTVEWLAARQVRSPLRFALHQDPPTHHELLEALRSGGFTVDVSQKVFFAPEQEPVGNVRVRLAQTGFGWITGWFDLAGAAIEMRGSHYADGWKWTVSALSSLLAGEQSATAVWVNEPGCHILVFTRVGSTDVRVAVWFDDTDFFGISDGITDPRESSRLVLDETVDLHDLAAALARASRALLDAYPDRRFPLDRDAMAAFERRLGADGEACLPL